MNNRSERSTIDISDKEWRAFIERLLPLGAETAKIFPPASDPQLRHDMFRMLFSELGAGFMQLMYCDPQYPDFIPVWGQVFNNAGNVNPDGVYYVTPLDDDGIYRLSGFRGSLRIVDLQIGDSTTIAYGKPNPEGTFGPTYANYELDSLRLGTDGAFECILSAERPQGYNGDWWHLHPGTNYLLVRQFSYDWLNEVDARIAIDRLDRPAQKPRQSVAQIKAALEQIPEFSAHWMKMILDAGTASGEWGSAELDNKVVLIDYSKDQAGRATQMYVSSRFDLTTDEALLVELAPGKCRYWNLHIGNELLNTLDFMNRQVSLNGFMARADDDGVYRIVISSRDPGVPNWLDTMDHRRGFIWGRLDTCENTTAPTTRKIKISEVRNHLPQDTPVITPEQRDAAIRLRRKGAQLRRRW